jgi:hypothetical protein
LVNLINSKMYPVLQASPLLILIPVLFLATNAVPAQEKLPVIDMHLHAHEAAINGPPPTTICAPPMEMPYHDPYKSWATAYREWLQDPDCPTAIMGAKNNEELKQKTLKLLDTHNIYAVTSGPYVNDYKKAGGTRILPGLSFNFFNSDWTPEKLHGLLSTGAYRVFGEVGIQYNGISPSDSLFDPYAAVAEELDIPMGIHIGTGPPGAPYLPGLQNYRASLHSPLVVEDLLLRHPRLRIYLMHAGYPMIDDLLAVMWAHPQVYADVGIICYAIPRVAFHNYIRQIVEAGFGKRIMFGSDQMNWPEAIEVGIEAIESAAFLTSEQKRDILYNNAARFLRLSAAEIKSHHDQN